MEAFFFDGDEKPLLGFYHPASGSGFNSKAIVICNPIGHEFVRAHSALRTLALNLSRNGNHVLRFDYYATGDSGGDSDEASATQWIADIVRACHELENISGCESLSIAGIRFGALLALYASCELAVSNLLLIDPVTSGEAYLAELAKMQQTMLDDKMRFHQSCKSMTDTAGEFIGHPFSLELQQEIRELAVGRLNRVKASEIDVFQIDTMSNVEYERLGCPVTIHQVRGEANWDDVAAIEDKVNMTNMLSSIAETF